MKNALCLAALFVIIMFVSGCLTTNWHHNRRHFEAVREDLRIVHQQFDEVFLHLKEDPTEKYRNPPYDDAEFEQ